MRYFFTRSELLGVLLLAALPVFADTTAGLTAFKNKDYQRAYREWKAAADAGQAEAQFDLGVLYAQGLGVRRDRPEPLTVGGVLGRRVPPHRGVTAVDREEFVGEPVREVVEVGEVDRRQQPRGARHAIRPLTGLRPQLAPAA